MVQIIPFTRTLTHTREHGHTRVHLRDVVDEFHDQNGFTNAGTAEQTNFTTLGVGSQKVDYFDTCCQDLGLGGLLGERWRVAVDAACFCRVNRALLVNGVARYVQDTAQCAFTNRHLNGCAGVGDLRAANQTLGRVHRNGTNCVLTKVLGHFEDQFGPVVFSVQSVQDLWQVIFELHVDDGADNLRNFSDCMCHVVSPDCLQRFRAGNDFDQLVRNDGLT